MIDITNPPVVAIPTAGAVKWDFSPNAGEPSQAAKSKQDAYAALASLVQQRWQEGVAAKADVTTTIIECRRAMAGVPITGSHIDTQLPIVLNVSASIAEGLYALMVDAINVSAESLFTLKSTPAPTLSDTAQAELLGSLAQQIEAMAAMGQDPDFDTLTQAQTALQRALMDKERETAAQAAVELQPIIRDQLLEGGFREAMALFLHDYIESVAGIIKAPSHRLRKIRVWDGGRLTFKDSVERCIERIDPDCFFLPRGARDVQSAEWCIERRRVQPSELLGLGTDSNFDSEQITKLLNEYPQGHVEIESNVASFSMAGDGTAYTRSYAYDVLVMSGKIKGQVLQDIGIEVGDVNMVYESVIWAIGNYVISAQVNTDVSGQRPYYIDSYYKDPTSPWGGGPVARLRDLQRVITSLFIAMAGDAAMAGVYVEVNPSMLHDDDKAANANCGANAVRPRQIRHVKAGTGPDGRKRAYDIYSIATQVASFQQEINNLHALAYEITGVPRMAVGQMTGSSTVGRTSGGVRAMLAQATKGMRRALQDIERLVIEPAAQSFVDHHLRFKPPPNFRGDINAMVRGLSGLVEQAEDSQNYEWALQTLGAIAGKAGPDGQPLVPPQAFQLLMYKLFKTRGIATDGIFPDFDRIALTQGGMPGLGRLGVTPPINDLQGVGGAIALGGPPEA